jgi:2-polyprenyl-3-methyl-5-hydroxy-6-metoxy-1,4-benzoquinol methylase
MPGKISDPGTTRAVNQVKRAVLTLGGCLLGHSGSVMLLFCLMERYFTELATAFVRGRLDLPGATIEAGLEGGLKLHKFKRNTELPRVQRVLGILRGIQPENLLDIGSGRGTFLWPLLASFPLLPVTAIDINERRVDDLDAVRRGGIERLCVARMDVQQLAFPARSFDVVTMLEVLEHLPNPQLALTRAMEAARRFVVVSVPSTPDENPEHLRLFSMKQLIEMVTQAGGTQPNFEHVLNHRIMLCRMASL